MVGEDILYLPVRELGNRIRKRTLSPVELTESYLERARRIGPKLGAFASLTPELALEQARAAEKEIAAGHYRGPLHGVPYAAKDLVAVTLGVGFDPYLGVYHRSRYGRPSLALDLAEEFRPLISHRVPLAETVQGFELSIRKQASKVVVMPKLAPANTKDKS